MSRAITGQWGGKVCSDHPDRNLTKRPNNNCGCSTCWLLWDARRQIYIRDLKEKMVNVQKAVHTLLDAGDFRWIG